jgi:hypothetical protein
LVSKRQPNCVPTRLSRRAASLCDERERKRPTPSPAGAGTSRAAVVDARCQDRHSRKRNGLQGRLRHRSRSRSAQPPARGPKQCRGPDARTERPRCRVRRPTTLAA